MPTHLKLLYTCNQYVLVFLDNKQNKFGLAINVVK